MNKITHSQLQRPKPDIKLGQFYCDTNGETFFIAKINSECYRIISIESGDRWDDNVYSLKSIEAKMHLHDFTLVTEPFTVTPNA